MCNKNKPIIKVIAVCIAVSFVFTVVLQDAWAAIPTGGFMPGTIPAVSNEDIGMTVSELDVDTFSVPAELGDIKYSHKGTNGKFIVHLQDAHCNYYAQKQISGLLDHLSKEYGINMLNLEGGKEEYDLKIFTSIIDLEKRKAVSEYFLKDGRINGAEFFGINTLSDVQLWGVEDKELYYKNLKVYRESILYKEKAENLLRMLGLELNKIKKDIYNEYLLQIDIAYSAYKADNMDFKEYVKKLFDMASAKNIDIEKNKNIYLLKQVIDLEEKVDFKKSTQERTRLIEMIKKCLSKFEMNILVEKSMQFKTKRLPEIKYYEYLITKAEEVGLSIKLFPYLESYMSYTALYASVDKDKIMTEMEALEEEIKQSLYENKEQETLAELSKTLALLKNLFSYTLTKTDHDYYVNNRSSFEIKNFMNFIGEEKLFSDIFVLDEYRIKTEKFFEYSFERDDAFMKNMRFAHQSGIFGNRKNTECNVIMTGGFHTDNLLKKMRDEGYSYVSIIPKFTNENGYESNYFKLLAGTNVDLVSMIKPIVAAVSNMQVLSLNSPKILDLFAQGDAEALETAVNLLSEKLPELRNNTVIKVQDIGIGINITLSDGSVYHFSYKELGITDPSSNKLFDQPTTIWEGQTNNRPDNETEIKDPRAGKSIAPMVMGLAAAAIVTVVLFPVINSFVGAMNFKLGVLIVISGISAGAFVGSIADGIEKSLRVSNRKITDPDEMRRIIERAEREQIEKMKKWDRRTGVMGKWAGSFVAALMTSVTLGKVLIDLEPTWALLGQQSLIIGLGLAAIYGVMKFSGRNDRNSRSGSVSTQLIGWTAVWLTVMVAMFPAAKFLFGGVTAGVSIGVVLSSLASTIVLAGIKSLYTNRANIIDRIKARFADDSEKEDEENSEESKRTVVGNFIKSIVLLAAAISAVVFMFLHSEKSMKTQFPKSGSVTNSIVNVTEEIEEEFVPDEWTLLSHRIKKDEWKNTKDQMIRLVLGEMELIINREIRNGITDAEIANSTQEIAQMIVSSIIWRQVVAGNLHSNDAETLSLYEKNTPENGTITIPLIINSGAYLSLENPSSMYYKNNAPQILPDIIGNVIDGMFGKPGSSIGNFGNRIVFAYLTPAQFKKIDPNLKKYLKPLRQVMGGLTVYDFDLKKYTEDNGKPVQKDFKEIKTEENKESVNIGEAINNLAGMDARSLFKALSGMNLALLGMLMGAIKEKKEKSPEDLKIFEAAKIIISAKNAWGAVDVLSRGKHYINNELVDTPTVLLVPKTESVDISTEVNRIQKDFEIEKIRKELEDAFAEYIQVKIIRVGRSDLTDTNKKQELEDKIRKYMKLSNKDDAPINEHAQLLAFVDSRTEEDESVHKLMEEFIAGMFDSDAEKSQQSGLSRKNNLPNGTGIVLGNFLDSEDKGNSYVLGNLALFGDLICERARAKKDNDERLNEINNSLEKVLFSMINNPEDILWAKDGNNKVKYLDEKGQFDIEQVIDALLNGELYMDIVKINYNEIREMNAVERAVMMSA
ncbi:MAG: hypothetical protein HQL29_04295 [Candidatus Omnitrophica bacterium]|nr:hypothetical protein [Candidatus Omnitrophota bacterium]